MIRIKLALAAILTLALSGTTVPSAVADLQKAQEAKEGTSQEVFQRASTFSEEEQLVVLTDSTGVATLKVKPGEFLGEALSRRGLEPSDYRDQVGNAVSWRLVPDETLFLFRVEYQGSAERIDLPAPVVKLRVNGLPQGERIVQEKGHRGEGIMTTVTLDDLSSDRKKNDEASSDREVTTTETLTVVQAPRPRIVLVSTKQDISETVASTIPEGDCTNGSTVPSTVTPDLIALHRAVCIKFPSVTTYGTYRDSCTYSCDHRDGYAVDIMVSGDTGWAIAAYLTSMAETFNIYYLIYEQQIWTREEPYWSPMEDRGSITANHFDHVHVSFNRELHEDH